MALRSEASLGVPAPRNLMAGIKDFREVHELRMKQKKGIIRRLFSSLAPSLLPGTVEDVFASLSGNVRKIC